MQEIKTIKISDKGQISIPKDIREEMHLREGETLFLIADGRRIVLERSNNIVKTLKESEGRRNMIMSERSLKKDWDNEYDEQWNKY